VSSDLPDSGWDAGAADIDFAHDLAVGDVE
jgi:hypothetical protein